VTLILNSSALSQTKDKAAKAQKWWQQVCACLPVPNYTAWWHSKWC